MLIQIAPLLGDKDTVSVIISRIDGTRLRATVIPKMADEDMKLFPIVLEGTAAELDDPALNFAPIVQAKATIAETIATAAAASIAANKAKKEYEAAEAAKVPKAPKVPAKTQDEHKAAAAPLEVAVPDAPTKGVPRATKPKAAAPVATNGTAPNEVLNALAELTLTSDEGAEEKAALAAAEVKAQNEAAHAEKVRLETEKAALAKAAEAEKAERAKADAEKAERIRKLQAELAAAQA
jgi:hypothetical protein